MGVCECRSINGTRLSLVEWKWNEETGSRYTRCAWGAMGSLIVDRRIGNYIALHLSAWPPSNAEDKGPVKRSSVREMHYPWNFNGMNPNYKYPDGRVCPAVSAYNYGLGWFRDCDGKIYIGHSGGLPGFGSQWRIMPEYGIGVVALQPDLCPDGLHHTVALDTLVKIAGLKASYSSLLLQYWTKENKAG